MSKLLAFRLILRSLPKYNDVMRKDAQRNDYSESMAATSNDVSHIPMQPQYLTKLTAMRLMKFAVHLALITISAAKSHFYHNFSFYLTIYY